VTIEIETLFLNREQTCVVAMRVSITDRHATQPTLDVNLEIQPIDNDATCLVLAGIIRPKQPPTTNPAITGDSDDLRSGALRFLNELAALAARNATTLGETSRSW
jgi:hypothetical protein